MVSGRAGGERKRRGRDELDRGEGDPGPVHERARAQIPRVDAGPFSAASYWIRAANPRSRVPDASLLDPRP